MIGPDKQYKLETLFRALPDSMIQQLYGSLSAGDSDGVELILQRLLTRVAQEREILLEEPLVLAEPALEEDDDDGIEDEPAPFVAPRNAMHAFFLPFESLIIDPPRYAERIAGYLCSTSLPAIWRMLNDETSGGAIRDAWVRTELSREDRSKDYYLQVTAEMHTAAGVVIEDIVARSEEDEAYARSLAQRLGGNGALGDLAEMKAMMAHISRFREVFDTLRTDLRRYSPRRAPRLAQKILEGAGEDDDLRRYLQLGVLSNLDAPWQGLWLHRALADESGQDDVSAIADHLLGVLTLQHRWLAARLDGEGPDEALLAPFTGFSELLAGMSEAGDRLAPAEAEALDRLAGSGRAMFEQLAEVAAGALERVLPVTAADDAHGAWDGDAGKDGPDLDWIEENGEEEATVSAARDAALFLSAGDEMAGLYNREALWSSLREETAKIVERYVTGLAAWLGEMTPEERARYQAKVAYLIPVAEALVDSACVAPLRRIVEKGARIA